MKALSEFKPGEKGIIKSIDDPSTALILMELGCLPGSEILLENIAPFGDPIAVKVAGYKLSLRKSEAKHVFVEMRD